MGPWDDDCRRILSVWPELDKLKSKGIVHSREESLRLISIFSHSNINYFLLLTTKDKEISIQLSTNCVSLELIVKRRNSMINHRLPLEC